MLAEEKEQPLVRSTVTTLLLFLQNGFEASTENRGQEALLTLNALRNLLAEIQSFAIRPADLADKLQLPVRKLNAHIQSITGLSTTEYVSAQRIQEARKLLAFTGLTIDEIAFQLDFFDGSHFAKFFKQRMEVSPGEYRETFHTEKR